MLHNWLLACAYPIFVISTPSQPIHLCNPHPPFHPRSNRGTLFMTTAFSPSFGFSLAFPSPCQEEIHVVQRLVKHLAVTQIFIHSPTRYSPALGRNHTYNYPSCHILSPPSSAAPRLSMTVSCSDKTKLRRQGSIVSLSESDDMNTASSRDDSMTDQGACSAAAGSTGNHSRYFFKLTWDSTPLCPPKFSAGSFL